MKTQNVNNKLKFEKNSVFELNNSQINEINGGTLTYLEAIIPLLRMMDLNIN